MVTRAAQASALGLAALFLALGPPHARAQVAHVPLPRIVTAPLAPTPASVIAEDQLTWRAWPDADPSRVIDGPAPRAGFVARPGGAWADIGSVASGRPQGETWTLLVEGSRHAGVTRGPVHGSPQSKPPIQLIALPVPAARESASGVELAWEPPSIAALEGVAILRTTDGVAWEILGRAAADEGAFLDRDAPDVALYALRLILLGGLAGREMSATVGVGADADADGLPDGLDRCAAFADPDQRDSDGDGVSDACDFAWGDVHPSGRPDGVITAGDIVRMLRFAVELETPSPPELRAADVAPADPEIGAEPGLPALLTPRVRSVHVVAVDDVGLALRAAVGLARFSAPR
jgi:hypothetical protein